MTPEVLLPETVAHRDGVGEVLEVNSSGSSSWMLSLNITRILEQECLELTVSGSPDSQHWLPLLRFPRKFYCGTYFHRLDLKGHPGVRYLRAEWRVTRLGPVETRVLCAFNVCATPLKMLHAGAV
jgi:hypothetical protein